MPNIHIVTDSGARFANPHFVRQHAITVIPNIIHVGGKTYREEVDLSAEEMLRLMSTSSLMPRMVPPTMDQYVEVYTRLARSYDAIISIHTSRELSESWHNANRAAQQLMGHSEIAVIDSQSLCAGQAMLVRAAVTAIQREKTVDDVIKAVRGAVDRIYSAYYVETTGYLQQNKIMSPSHAILGSLLGIKPFLTIEAGELMLIEKVRTRAQAVERLVEFVAEFTDLEDVVILQHKAHMSEQTRMLQDRLALEFPGRHFPYTVYGASLAAWIGADATGIVVLEGESENLGLEDDF